MRWCLIKFSYYFGFRSVLILKLCHMKYELPGCVQVMRAFFLRDDCENIDSFHLCLKNDCFIMHLKLSWPSVLVKSFCRTIKLRPVLLNLLPDISDSTIFSEGVCSIFCRSLNISSTFIRTILFFKQKSILTYWNTVLMRQKSYNNYREVYRVTTTNSWVEEEEITS